MDHTPNTLSVSAGKGLKSAVNSKRWNSNTPSEVDPDTGRPEVAPRWSRVATAVQGIGGALVAHIEASITGGFAGIQLVGNATETVRDGKERAKTAIEAMGKPFPANRILLSLTPADVKKDGNHFDLAFAIALWALLKGSRSEIALDRYMFAAELSLVGDLRPVRGIVSFAISAMAKGLDGIVVSEENRAELQALALLPESRIKPLKVFSFKNLAEVIAFVRGMARVDRICKPCPPDRLPEPTGFDDMVLDGVVKKAAIAIVAGGHSVLLRGCPGTGKTMFAERLRDIAPPMNPEEHLDAMMMHSMERERLPHDLLRGRPPFRSPHHSASAAAVLGHPDRPGEAGMSHGGLLFLDELPEFRRDLLESLREPLESGRLYLARSGKRGEWKARFILVAATNNCPCGWTGSHSRPCLCDSKKILAYQRRISGPILDRIDIHIQLPERQKRKLPVLPGKSQPGLTAEMSAIALKSRQFMLKRNQKWGVTLNRDIPINGLVDALGLNEGELKEMVSGLIPESTSSRSMIRVFRVARTLADLDASEKVTVSHVKQAVAWLPEKCAESCGLSLPGLGP